MTLWKLSYQELKNRLGRTLMTLLSVIIGVTTVVAVTMAVYSARTAFGTMYRSLAGEADLRIEGGSGGGFPENLIRDVRDIPGVSEVSPLLRENGLLYAGDEKVRILLFGVEPDADTKVHDYDVVQGAFFGGENEVLLEQGTAKGLSIKLGDEVRFLTRRGIQKKKVVGLLAPKGAAALNNGSVAFWQLPELQRAYRSEGKVAFAFVTVESEGQLARVQESIREALPKEVEVLQTEKQSGSAHDVRMVVEAAMAFSALLSIIAMGFVILNTFLMNVSERRRTMAMLRTLGATRKQIRWMLIREGLAMALIGAPIGVVLGAALAKLLVRAMERGFQVTLTEPQVSLYWLLYAIVGGAILVTGSVLYPANRAMAITPLEGLSRVEIQEKKKGRRIPLPLIGVLLIVIASIMIWLQTTRNLPVQIGVAGALMMLVASIFILPSMIVGAVHALGGLVQRFWPVTGQLSEQQLLRHRTRTQLTWTILFVAVTGAFALSNIFLDVISDVHKWFYETIESDYILRVTMPGANSGEAAGMDLDVGDEIRKIPGVTKATAARFFIVNGNGERMVAIARQFDPKADLPLAIRERVPRNEIRDKMIAGEVVLGTIAAEQLGISPGDELEVEYGGTTHKFRVAATVSVYAMGGMALIMHYDVAKEVFQIEGADVFFVNGDFETNPDIGKELKTIADQQGAVLQSFEDFSKMVDGMLSAVLASLWLILALGFLIALFGVVNTLNMNILEQTQEIGLMRVVGMTRKNIKQLILGQAIIHALLALIPGCIIGYLLAQLLRSTSLGMLGAEARLTNRPWLWLLFAAIVFAIVVLVSWLPARRASRVPMLMAIKRD